MTIEPFTGIPPRYPRLPPILENTPLRASFLPMSGCAHFCSFCADNSGKTERMHPFDLIRHSIGTMPVRLESAALYNACDGLTYEWTEGGKRRDITHVAELFRGAGCGALLFSSPGIDASPGNREILERIAGMDEAVVMLSFNREHLLERRRLENFLFTARTLTKKKRCAVRVVYCSPGERAALLDVLARTLGREGAFAGRSKQRMTLEVVPAAPLGRGRRVYFGNDNISGGWRRDIEEMIMGMYAREPHLRGLGFMTRDGYDAFLRHAAVQFSGFYIILLTPSKEGMELSLKVTDLDKTVATRGLAHSTLYRYDKEMGCFTHRSPAGQEKILKLLLFNSRRCTAIGFREYLDAAGSFMDRKAALRVFSSFIASDFMQDKNRISEGRHMMIMNREYVDFYRETLETVIASQHPELARDCAAAGVSAGDVFGAITGFLSSIGAEC